MKTSTARTSRMLVGLLLGAALAAPAAAVARADSAERLGPNIVNNGGFERGADPGVGLGLSQGSPFLEGWNVVGSETRVEGTYWQAQEGTRSLSLAKPGPVSADPNVIPSDASGVTQSLTTKVGQRYRVTFYQAGNPYDHHPSMIRIAIGSAHSEYTYQADAKATAKEMQWVQRSLTFTATAVSTPLAFYAWYTPGNDGLGLDNVQVRAVLPPASGTPAQPAKTPEATTPAAGVTLTLATPSVAQRGQQSVQVTAGKNAQLALVIDYPDGSQVVLPTHAGPDGRYSYTWSIPSGIAGTIKVFLDAGGTVARASFTVR